VATTTRRAPTLRYEREAWRAGAGLLAAIDEVGRGALAGPVTVGIVVVHAGTRTAPTGLRDSKLLTAAAREALVPRLRRWAVAWAVGHAEPGEIDAFGILAALRLAGTRALRRLPALPDAVLLDGSYDWLTRPVAPAALFDLDDLRSDVAGPGPAQADVEPGPSSSGEVDLPAGAVRTLVKGDLRCAAVAAASVLAKTERDAIMRERAMLHPEYCWAENKGYSAPEHLAALAGLGPCPQHRRSWRLPGCEAGPRDECTEEPAPQAETLDALLGLDTDADADGADVALSEPVRSGGMMGR
jgi:ribonuclease HII